MEKVIVIGAGTVGYLVAETIAEADDVMVIENDRHIAEKLRTDLNVSVLLEDGSNPQVLRDAIRKHSAETVISTLKDDSANILICIMAKRIKPEIKTVASVNNPDFYNEIKSDEYPEIDFVMSPELKVSEKMFRIASLENAIDYELVDEINAGVAIFKVRPEHKIVENTVLNLDLPENCTVFGIYRDNKLHLDTDTMEIREGDEICVFGSEESLEKFNKMMMETEIKTTEVIILGGSIVGTNVLKNFLANKRKPLLSLVEIDYERSIYLSKKFPDVTILNGDFKDPRVQRAENIFKSDCLIITSGSDDTNLLMCMSAKDKGCKVISRYFKPEFKEIFKNTGLDAIIGYHRIITNEIARCILPNEVAFLTLKESKELFFIHNVNKDSVFSGKYLGDVHIPDGIKIVAILRPGETGGIIYPEFDTRMLDGDQLIVFTNLSKESEFRKLFKKDILPEM